MKLLKKQPRVHHVERRMGANLLASVAVATRTAAVVERPPDC